jgi:hypothetical protein
MPKLKSAVNSFLLTKKRFKRRRKTNKRKRTNRRYKKWMRGGANLTKQQYDTFFGALGPNDKVVGDKIDERDYLIEKIIIKSLNGDTADTEPTEDNFKRLYAQHKVEDIDALTATLNSLEPNPLPDPGGQGAAKAPEILKIVTYGKDGEASSVFVREDKSNIPKLVTAGGGRRRR